MSTSLINSLPSNTHLVHVVYIVHVHICESISSHDVDNFMKNTIITCIMIIKIAHAQINLHIYFQKGLMSMSNACYYTLNFFFK